MSGYFDKLESELREAVQRTAASDRTPAAGGRDAWFAQLPGFASWRDRAPHDGPRLPALVPVVGVAVTLVVAVLAIGLLGHRHPHHAPAYRAAPPAGTAVTLSQLKANFAILRRPQTAADRAWRPNYGANAPHELRGLERLARRLAGGQRVFLTVQRAAGGAYALRVWIVASDGDATGSSFTAADDWTLDPVPTPVSTPRTSRWTSIVPDGVSRELWAFGCRTNRPAARCPIPIVVSPVAVRDNVATAAVGGTSQCSDATCAGPLTATWYDGAGAIVRVTIAGHHVAAPPFLGRQPPIPGGPVRQLAGNAVAGIPFGAPQATAARTMERVLHAPPGLLSRPDCGVQSLASTVVPIAANGSAPYPTGLTLFFGNHRLVGYLVGGEGNLPAGTPALRVATAPGLRIGDTLARARRIYGRAFHTSTAQGGSWNVSTATGPLKGSDDGRITAIAAGDTGCPATSP